MLESLFNKIAGPRPASLLKRDSGTSVFLRILRNFQEHIFYRTPLDNCFCLYHQNHLPLHSQPSPYLFCLTTFCLTSFYLTTFGWPCLTMTKIIRPLCIDKIHHECNRPNIATKAVVFRNEFRILFLRQHPILSPAIDDKNIFS